MAGGDGCQCQTGDWMLEGLSKVAETGGDAIQGSGRSGHFDVMWEPSEGGVGVMFASGFPGPHFITLIVFEGRDDIPGIFTVWSPCATLVRFLVDKDSRSWRIKRSAAVIVDAVELIPRG